MDEKTTSTINNLCTLVGGALLLYPLIDQAAKTIIPEMDKLTSGETLKEIKALPAKPEHKPEDKDEIAELKRKLAMYEEQAEHKTEQ